MNPYATLLDSSADMYKYLSLIGKHTKFFFIVKEKAYQVKSIVVKVFVVMRFNLSDFEPTFNRPLSFSVFTIH